MSLQQVSDESSTEPVAGGRLTVGREDAAGSRHGPRGRRHGGTRRRLLVLRLDGRPWLRVEPAVAAELGLADGLELDETRCRAIEAAVELAAARLFVVRSLAARAQTVAEIEGKLRRREIGEEARRAAIHAAERLGFLNDEDVARATVRSLRGRGYGRRRAEQMLGRRGVPRSLAAEAIASAYGEEGDRPPGTEAALEADAPSDVGLALRVLERRRAPSTPSVPGATRRDVAFLVRRGFPAAVAWRAARAAAEERRDAEERAG